MKEFKCILDDGQVITGKVKRGIIEDIPEGYNKYPTSYNLTDKNPWLIEPSVPTRYYGDIIIKDVIVFPTRLGERIGVRITEWKITNKEN